MIETLIIMMRWVRSVLFIIVVVLILGRVINLAVDVLVCERCKVAHEGLESGDKCPYCGKRMFTWVRRHEHMLVIVHEKV